MLPVPGQYPSPFPKVSAAVQVVPPDLGPQTQMTPPFVDQEVGKVPLAVVTRRPPPFNIRAVLVAVFFASLYIAFPSTQNWRHRQSQKCIAMASANNNNQLF